MSTSSTFGNLRRRLAPFIRPVFERFPPVRYFAVRLLKIKQSGKLHRCGMNFILPSGDFGVTLEAESTGEYEPVTTKLLESILEEGMTFVDVGAHVGLFTVPSAVWVGKSGKVIAFEPHPDNYEMLVQNISANGYAEVVEANQSAVSDETDSVHLHMSTFNTGDHQLFHHGGRNTIKVPCTTLDAYIDAGISVDVIKMDVQGAEAAAFRGMRRVLQDNHSIKVIWELSPAQLKDAGSSAKEVLLWLEELGFAMTIVDDATGEISKATTEEVLLACPHDSYINILCDRNG
jgi:FkbM family methyltransferase